jgi:predicted DNA-binding WGR domain protein
MIVYLEKVNAERGMLRFYRVTIAPSLFGGWVLVREWGRIGCGSGQRMEEWFAMQASAAAALERLVAAKRRKGYAG